MRYILLLFVFAIPLLGYTQTEAQSVEEYLLFQRGFENEKGQKIKLKEDDLVKYPDPETRRLKKGYVVGYTDSTLSLNSSRSNQNPNLTETIYLNQAPFIKVRNKRFLRAGAILLGIFALGNMIAGTFILVFSGVSYGLFYFSLLLLFNPLNYLLVILGITFLLCSFRKIKKGEWKSRRIKKVIQRIKG